MNKQVEEIREFLKFPPMAALDSSCDEAKYYFAACALLRLVDAQAKQLAAGQS